MLQRTVLFLCFVFIFAGCAGPATTSDLPNGVSDKRAPEKATMVVVTTDTKPQATLKTVSQILLSNGYAIDNSSDELLTITTKKIGPDPNGILPGTPEHRLSISLKENSTQIVFQGSEFGGEIQSKIKKYGQSGSPQRLAWKQLITVAHKVSLEVNGNISYKK